MIVGHVDDQRGESGELRKECKKPTGLRIFGNAYYVGLSGKSWGIILTMKAIHPSNIRDFHSITCNYVSQ